MSALLTAVKVRIEPATVFTENPDDKPRRTLVVRVKNKGFVSVYGAGCEIVRTDSDGNVKDRRIVCSLDYLSRNGAIEKDLGELFNREPSEVFRSSYAVRAILGSREPDVERQYKLVDSSIPGTGALSRWVAAEEAYWQMRKEENNASFRTVARSALLRVKGVFRPLRMPGFSNQKNLES